MALQHTDVIDAATLHEGWALLAMYHFEDWSQPEEKLLQLQRKFQTYLRFIDTGAYLIRFADRPVRMKLICTETPPESILQRCKMYTIEIDGPTVSI